MHLVLPLAVLGVAPYLPRPAPAHYRIGFNPDGDDDFVDPATMMELYSHDAVLLDGIVAGRRLARARRLHL